MTYKIGNKVLAEVFIIGEAYDGQGNSYYYIKGDKDDESLTKIAMVKMSEIRPYTPRQEFEYGEEVEVRSYEDHKWVRRIYVGTIHGKDTPYITVASIYDNEDSIHNARLDISSGNFKTHSWKYIRKIKPRETITIAGVTYDKAEFENAVKDLKPITKE